MKLVLQPDTVTAAAGDPPADGNPNMVQPVADGGARYRWLLTREDANTGDGRYYVAGAFTWRDLPLPFMAIDRRTEAHDASLLVANIVEIERVGNDIIGVTEDVVSDDPEVQRLQRLIADGDLRGVSVDMDSVEGYIEWEVPDDAEAEMPQPGDVVRMDIGADVVTITASRIIGATALPFQAFAEAGRIDEQGDNTGDGANTAENDDQEALVASMQRPVTIGYALTASAGDYPTRPPASWFNPPPAELGPFAVEYDDTTGRIVGYLAAADSCHRGLPGCATAPLQDSFDHFHVGTILTDDGQRLPVGTITLDGGHAHEDLPADAAADYYSHTGFAAGYVRCGVNEHGIWMAGVLRAGIDEQQLQRIMAAEVSGDWRRIDGRLQLVAVAAVNSPGFYKARVAEGATVALVASLAPCTKRPTVNAVRERIALSIGRHPDQLAAERDEIARRVGRDRATRRASIAARVAAVKQVV
jgi:hypothetical protein